MTLPSPAAVRLVCRDATARVPTPPFGVRAFSDEPDAAIAVLLDIGADQPERAQVDAACAQLPDAADVPAGRLVVILAERAAARGLFTRLFGGARANVPVAVRSTALLARGYRSIEAGTDTTTDHVLVWGLA